MYLSCHYTSRHSTLNSIELIEAIPTHLNVQIRRFFGVFIPSTQFPRIMDRSQALQAITTALQLIATALPAISATSDQQRPSDLPTNQVDQAQPAQAQADQAQADQAQADQAQTDQAQCISTS